MKKNIVPQGTLSSPKEKTHLVILGAGFGGVYTYKSLPTWVKNSCNITIVDKRNHFLFTPLLPEVAGASLDEHSIVEPIRDIVKKKVNFIQSTVVSVNTKTQTVELPDREISYDILVSALGSTTHFFGTPGAEEFAYTLKDLEDATRLRDRFIDTFEEASREQNELRRKQLLTFMVVGAGPTGVELTGEIADLFFSTFDKQYGNLNIDEVQLLLVNGGDEVLGMFDKKLRVYAGTSLINDGVTLKNNVRVAEVTDSGVITTDGEVIKAHTVVWAAGVTANSLNCLCGSFDVERGRIHVTEKLLAKNTHNVFVVGDMGLFPTEDGRGLPMTAQIAKQQGVTTGKNIGRLLQEQSLQTFIYKEKGLLASLGSFDAVAQIKGVKLTGIVAWFMWRTIYLFNFASYKKRFKIMSDWTINLFSRRDTTRL